jgi:hypothetical protein
MKPLLTLKKRNTWFHKKAVYQVKKIVVIASIVIVLFACMSQATQLAADDIYPQGKQFPLGLYSIHTAKEMNVTRPSGWNISHTYHFTPSFFEIAKEGKMRALANLPGKFEPIPENQAATVITTLAKSDRVAWWNFPEERRYWRAGEKALIANYAKWTRKYDPKKRPNYMYIPGHYSTKAVQQYVGYLDVIPASVYTTYAHQPHAWVRWRMESTVNAIQLAKAKIGFNYLQGEKTPVAVLELFHDQGDPLTTPQGAYHDFWQSIVSGARGILIFSYWHKRDHPILESVWQIYNQAAKQITGSEQLGSAILFGGRSKNVQVEITRGPNRTNQFLVDDSKQPLSFPSVDTLTLVWNKLTYVIAVNSAEKPVTAKLTNLPLNATQATVLFENSTVSVSNGSINTSFQPLGVHIFKLNTQAKS